MTDKNAEIQRDEEMQKVLATFSAVPATRTRAWIQADDRCKQQLKAALWFSIGKTVDEETSKVGIKTTSQFIAGLAEMVWSQIGKRGIGCHAMGDFFADWSYIMLYTETVSKEIEAFAK